jgi:hypothetical protein
MTDQETLHGSNNVSLGCHLPQSHKWTIFLTILDEFSHQKVQNQSFPAEKASSLCD